MLEHRFGTGGRADAFEEGVEVEVSTGFDAGFAFDVPHAKI